jgi:DNA-binding NarL/FixJ family response regulator
VSTPIQISLIEDDAGVRRELEALLNAAPGFRCRQTYADAESALADLPCCPPDLVLLDVHLPGLSGIECVRRLKEVRPALPVIILTVHDDRDKFLAAVAAGADGYLLKRSPRAELLAALREVRAGGVSMNGRIARWTADCFHGTAQGPGVGGAAPGLPTLTTDEEELVVRLAQGHSSAEIVAALGLGDDRVRGQLVRIHEKLRLLLRLRLTGGRV